MKNKTVAVGLRNISHEYQIEIGRALLKASGEWARECLSPKTKKIALVSNTKVYPLYGDAVVESLENAGFEVGVFMMKDGERYKSLRTLEQVLKFFGEKKMARTDAALALGGGVVGDLTGFAAAIFLRGIAFLQIPTSLLAMIDSSVGGKTGINTEFGKNLVGAFHQPDGVLIDVETLRTLPKRELTAGFCEAVKQAVIADRALFDETAGFLKKFPLDKFKNHLSDESFSSAIENLIAVQVNFKARIVMQDEREDVTRTDAKSRKILNFGHTLAHALEKITGYKRFKHGEAVGYGIAFAAALSKKLEILNKDELKSLNDVLQNVGKLPDAHDINLDTLHEAFAFDKKVIGKSLQWILLKGIGQPVIIENRDVPPRAVGETLEEVLHGKFASEDL